MYNIKKAFTLTEVMIVMTIMSIIIFVFMQTNPFAPKYKTLYYYTYLNMKKFAGELIATRGNSTLDTNDATFCTSLASALNTVGGSSSCAVFYNATASSPFNGMVAANIDSPSFTLSNGQRFYVSNRITGTPGYRIISVDLNGLSKPNAFDADVVPFAMIDNGEILPLGNPVNDTGYLWLTVEKYAVSSGKSSQTFVSNASGKNALTFREGYCLAGNTSIFPGYCPGTLPLPAPVPALTAITTNAACAPGAATFCVYKPVKPLINVKI